MPKYQFLRILDEKDFENFVRDLFNNIENTNDYSNTEFQLFGKKGQNQKGIDIISLKRKTAIQCKCKDVTKSSYDKIREQLIKDIQDDLAKTKSLNIKIDRLIFTSTFIDDAQLQEFVDNLKNKENLPFTIEYWGWETLTNYLERFSDLIIRYFGDVLPKIAESSDYVLTRDDYYKIIVELIDLERISLGDYLEEKYKRHIDKNPNFIKILYKDINFVLDGIYKDNELDLAVENGDFVVEYGDLKLEGNPNNLVYVLNYLHTKLFDSFMPDNMDLEIVFKRMEQFQKDFLKINYNTLERNEKLIELRKKLILDKNQSE